jgi:hypothetical protein
MEYKKSIIIVAILIFSTGVVSFFPSCVGTDLETGFSVTPHFGKTQRYACDISSPPKAGEAPCDIDSFKLCAYSEKLNSILCKDYDISEGSSGVKLNLPAAEDYRIFFQGYNKAKSDVNLWCGATDKISLKKGEKKDVSMFIGRCSDFVFTRSKMSSPRAFHTATLLKDGRVLIVGGIGSVSTKSCDKECDGNGCKPYCKVAEATSDIEIYDFTKGEFSKVGKLNIPRALHTATLLDDGRVLIAGGTRAVRLYLVPEDSKPFVMPDAIDDASTSIEIFDPQNNSVKKVDSSVARAMHTAYMAKNGKIYAIGGVSDMSGEFEARMAEIKIDSGMVDAKVSLSTGRVFPNIVDFSLVDVTSTAIAVVGGSVLDEKKGGSFDIISFAEATPTVREHGYTTKEANILSAIGVSAIPVDGIRLLLAGGYMMKDCDLRFNNGDYRIVADNPLDFTFYFDLTSNNVSYPARGDRLLYRRAFAQASYLYNKNPRIIFTGGFEKVNPDFLVDSSVIPFIPSNAVEIFICSSEIFDTLHPEGVVDAVNPVIKMNESRALHTMTALPDNTILITGGFKSGSDISSSAEVFQPYPVSKVESLLVY